MENSYLYLALKDFRKKEKKNETYNFVLLDDEDIKILI